MSIQPLRGCSGYAGSSKRREANTSQSTHSTFPSHPVTVVVSSRSNLVRTDAALTRISPPALAVLRTLGLAAVVVVVISVLAASARADRASDRVEQRRYALETLNLHYPEYVARANDFRAKGCWHCNRPQDCDKPLPYNYFDWTTDGCSIPGPKLNTARIVFNRPCQLHDFGYRNFGKGLTLERTEDRRNWIDNRFRDEMYRICRDPRASLPLGGYANCRGVALVM